MLFFTIVLFAVSLAFLVKGVFPNLSIEIGEEAIKKATDKSYKGDTTLGIKVTFFILFVIIYAIIEVVYLIKALSIDPYIFPTVLMILNLIISPLFQKNKENKKDLSTNEGIQEYRKSLYKKKRTFIGYFKGLLIALYFAYMFYIQVF